MITFGDTAQAGGSSAIGGFCKPDPAQDNIPDESAEDHPSEEKDDAPVSRPVHAGIIAWWKDQFERGESP